MLTQPNNEMRNFKRQVLTRVRGLREEREKAADEYASTLVNLRSLRARLQVAEHEAQTVRERARKAGNTVAELLAIEELIENSWKDSREPAVSESSEGGGLLQTCAKRCRLRLLRMMSPSWQLPAATGRLMVWKAACDGVEAGAQADVEMGEGRVHGGCDTAGARLGHRGH